MRSALIFANVAPSNPVRVAAVHLQHHAHTPTGTATRTAR